MPRTKVGQGIFSWGRGERVTNRYGSFGLYLETYKGVSTKLENPGFSDNLQAFKGKRVRVTCVVAESPRKSGHCGDFALGISPTMPEPGAVVDLGVGILQTEEDYLVLAPGDGRDQLWMDPHKLYTLHDQGVEVFVEETLEDFTPMVELKCDAGVFAVDGSEYQCKQVDIEKVVLPPTLMDIKSGLFRLGPPKFGNPGERVPYVIRKEDQ